MKWLVVAVLSVAVLAPAGVASAHVLKSDNGISAVLHVTPNDKPLSGKVSQLQLAFGDTHDAFSLQDCDCSVALARDETVVFAHPKLVASSTLYGVVQVTFPRPALYDVLVSGHSKDGKFPDFHLDYDVDVAPGIGTTSQRHTALIAEGAIALVMIGLLAVIIRLR